MSGTSPTSMKAKPVILWCHPRSCSSALVRSFREHPNIKVAHEPLIPILGSSNIDLIYSDRIPFDLEWRDVTRVDAAQLLAENKLPRVEDGILRGDEDDGKSVFIKEMAQSAFSAEAMVAIRPESTFQAPEGSAAYSVPDPVDATPSNPTVFPVELLKKFTHTFLIREPARAIPSCYRGVSVSDAERASQGIESRFSSDLAAWISYRELRILYNFIADPKSEFNTAPGGEDEDFFPQPQPPPLIDADDLTRDPAKVLEGYCEKIGIPFDPRLLHWNLEPVKEFDLPWRFIYREAEESTGFTHDNRTLQEAIKTVHESQLGTVNMLIDKHREDYDIYISAELSLDESEPSTSFELLAKIK
ncbi:hypothetical protein SISNIDRAFT_273701 [Sistotremastrum niveocremeum HHB9708]|uniref:Uncharacterized protein n=2 Tax=Sistotremastraceae TaxID=3402574 RepID=A0A164NVT0_9AGAM|nr:hypothetical protein SISNIDRAFT_273701 [Sistotremastrum niveocremeum HHB9708]KZT40485.1 hypothetical protein SISSUDRAFT_481809 [Sistotremastrum suecicum HHB10207 ss-3]